MNHDQIVTQRTYWNQTWTRPPRRRIDVGPRDHWLSNLLDSSRWSPPAHVLEIGCGHGADTRYLLGQGFTVTSLDLSRAALRQVAALSPVVQVVEAALPSPLPFVSEAFELVVAGLSLHYFRWSDTLAIIADIHRVLRPGGVLIFRVNAAGDKGYGFGRGVEVEPNLFLRDGRTKRFFTAVTCRELFDEGWELEVVQSQIDQLYDPPKHTWSGRARRC